MTDAEFRRCPICGERKPLTDFYRCKTGRDGRQARCKQCDNARKKEWIRSNPERHYEFTQNWKKAHPDEQAAIHARARARRKEKNPKFAVEAVERHRLRHPEKDKARRTLQRAVREGRIKKPETCADCGSKIERRALHGHHEDYSKPLEVEWLCRTCHEARHHVG